MTYLRLVKSHSLDLSRNMGMKEELHLSHLLRMKILSLSMIAVVLLSLPGCRAPAPPEPRGELPSSQRTWIGPDYWANRLQDWTLAHGRIWCTYPGPNRNLSLISYHLAAEEGDFHVSLDIQFLLNIVCDTCWAGLKIGSQGIFDDYRDDAVYGKGLAIGVTQSGNLKIGDQLSEVKGLDVAQPIDMHVASWHAGVITITLVQEGFQYVTEFKPGRLLEGQIALVSHYHSDPSWGAPANFGHWTVSG